MSEIQIMRADPVISNGRTCVRIGGRSVELFRLLVLNQGATVSNDAISALRDTESDTAKSKIRYLRGQLKPLQCESLIENDRSLGYRASLAGWHVDALAFQSTVSRVEASLDYLMAHPIGEATARADIESMVAALGNWNDNPALGLAGEYQKHFAHYAALKRKAEDRLLMARLYSKDRSQIREAIQELMARAEGSADDLIWELLLLAHHAIGSSITNVIDKMSGHYRRIGSGGSPQRLTTLIAALTSGPFGGNPFRPADVALQQDTAARANHDYGSDDPKVLRDLCSTLGITTASQLRLTDSRLAPLACVQRTRKRLYFSGVLASKWVSDPPVRKEFSRLLSRLDQEGGDVRFLIINPESDSFRRLVELRDGAISTESLVPLGQLAAQHKSLSVRLYDSLPAFRVVAIDDDVLSFSPYRLGAEAYFATKGGWEAPHIVLDPLADYPLAEAFRLLFMEAWQKAVPMEIAR